MSHEKIDIVSGTPKNLALPIDRRIRVYQQSKLVGFSSAEGQRVVTESGDFIRDTMEGDWFCYLEGTFMMPVSW